MRFPNYFADAETNYKDADYVIVGFPYDKTSSFRPGAQHGPKEIRKASWNFETFDLRTKKDLKDIKVHDYGDIDVTDLSPTEMIQKVKEISSKILKDNKIPVFIGGEHSITPGVIQAYQKDIAVISLDAHIDYREEYENEKFNHACAIKRISDHIPMHNIAVLGIRSAEKKEYENAIKHQLFHIDAFTIRKKGLSNVLDETKKHIGNKQIYLTLDIDVIDPAYAPATSTPEPFGLMPDEIVECIEYFSNKIVGFDLVEVCPPYGNGQTALLAAKIIRIFLLSNSKHL